MHMSACFRIGRRTLQALALAGLLVVAPAPSNALPGQAGLGARTAAAQGGMDIGIVSPAFSGLPASVQPGQEFTVTAVTAAGARCAGWLTFRNHPPIALEDQPAPGGTCSWAVTVPPTTRPGTGTIAIVVSRNGQSWGLYGVTYVTAVGESR